MDFSTEIRVVDSGNLKAYVTLIIDNEIAISGFRILESKSGELFVAAPSHKGTNGEGKETYYDDVRFIGDREEGAKDSVLGRECKDFILSQYRREGRGKPAAKGGRDDKNASAAKASSRAQPASNVKPEVPTTSEAPAKRERKSLPW